MAIMCSYHDLEGYLPSLERRREILVKNQLLEKLLTEWTQKIAQQIYFLIANLPRRVPPFSNYRGIRETVVFLESLSHLLAHRSLKVYLKDDLVSFKTSTGLIRTFDSEAASF